MVKVLTVKVSKGGVGKTTIACHLGHSLALHGKKVLLVDLDAQNSLSKILARNIVENENSFSSADYLVNNYDDPKEIIHEVSDNFHFMKSHRGLSVAIESLQDSAEASYLKSLRERLRRDYSDFDYIILDMGYGVADDLTRMSYIAADMILAPVELNNEAIDGLGVALDDIEELRDDGLLNLVGPEILIIPNKYNKVFKGENDRIYKILKDAFEDNITLPIRQNSNIKKGYSEGKTGIQYELELEKDLEERRAQGRLINTKQKVDKKAFDDFSKLAKIIMEVK